MIRVTRRATIALGGLAALQALQLACGSTTGRRLMLETRIRASALHFATALGYQISLDRAVIAIAELRYLQDPASDAVYADDSVAGAARLLGPAVAHAHPGHEGAVALGEMLRPQSVDLAEGELMLDVGPAFSGAVGTAKVGFGDGWCIWLEGRATRDGATHAFRARAGAGELMSDHAAPEIYDCPFAGELLADGVVTLTMHVDRWLDDVDLALVPHGGDLDPVVPGTHDAFVTAVRDPSTYSFDFTPG